MVEDAADVLDPFSSAENAADLVLDQVLQEGGKLLYESYIARKSFAFAAAAACEVLVGEMKMQFVSYDRGEGQQLVKHLVSCRPATGSKADIRRHAEDDVSGARGAVEAVPRPGSAPASTNGRLDSAATATQMANIPETAADKTGDSPGISEEALRDGWCLESEPSRCRIDTWARACVPVRKSRQKMVGHNDSSRKGHASNGSVSVPSSRSPSRFGAHTVVEGAEGLKQAARNQMIPLIDEREEDAEEMMLRDLKEREARKHREEHVRAERKAAEEEAAKLVQVKDDKKRQFTYDSEGNMIAVQPPQLNRLPNPCPAMTFVCKEEEHSQEIRQPEEKRAPRARDRSTKGKRRDSSEFKDGFKKFLSQQPSMMEAMVMSPGVELEERNKTKRGEKIKIDPGTMSRKEYEEGIQRVPPSKTGAMPDKTPPTQPSTVQESNSASGAAVLPVAQAAEGPSPDAAKNVRSEGGSDLVKAPTAPKAPPPRPLEPSAPSTRKRVQPKRDALGYSLSARERLRINAGSRFPHCPPQPPLGATMGHGLLPQSSKDQEFYFPGATSILGEEELRTPREQFQGQIVSKNAQLKRRLFEGR
mmetsp:Transcript_22872/g.53946  ORF Transcript_22872/g.53946 Transcript_22872/m.53946 type:complete len:589 (-) Transcript_22872:131-1897(-)